MKLFEHPDFEQAIIRTARHFQAQGLRESIIEKDYYVTEALRRIAHHSGEKVIFKGGTSLSKGWNLIQRFSEDIDIFLDPLSFTPSLGKKAIDRELKSLRQAINEHPALRFVENESQTIGGFGRNDRFEYQQRFEGIGDIRNRVLVEAGTASGREPTQQMAIQSYVGQFLEQTGFSLGADDEEAFQMRLLHFRRTFVEKMFAIHAKVVAFQQSGTPIGSYARHYYDIFCLAITKDVVGMLKTDEYGLIKTDYDRVSTKYFPKSYVPPPEMSFARSEALFPQGELELALAEQFTTQCRLLCFGPIPSWGELKSRLESIRELL